jgi:hypothetical protein
MKRLVQVAGATYFLFISVIGGAILLLWSPSFWYVICAAGLLIAGILWLFRPAFAAAFATPPIIGLAFLFGYFGMTRDTLYLALILLMAIALVVIPLRRGLTVAPLIVSICFILVGFWVDRTFTQKIKVRAYDMHWSVDGQVPWGNSGPLEQNGKPLVVVYRNLDGGYCYDALYSTELKQTLLKDAPPTVRVEYDLFINFGKETGYNIRSVDGVQFNDGLKSVRDEKGFGGHMLPGNSGPYEDCR